MVAVEAQWLLLLAVGILSYLDGWLQLRWDHTYYQKTPPLFIHREKASATSFPIALDVDLEAQFWKTSPFASLRFQRLSATMIAFREVFTELRFFSIPVFLHGVIVLEGSSPKIVVRGSSPWTVPVALAYFWWVLSHVIDPAAAGVFVVVAVVVWQYVFRRRVRTVARAVVKGLE